MTPTMIPVLTFIGGFAGGLGLGASDLIRQRLGYPKQDRTRRADMVLQAVGVVMLILVGTTTYEQLHSSADRRREVECQARYNDQFREGLSQRAQANKVSTDAELAFVQAQVRFSSEMKDRDAPQSERDQAFNDFYHALAAKEQALQALDRVREDNPVAPSGEC